MLAAGFDFNTERAHHSIVLHPSIYLLLYPGVEGGRWKLSQLSFERERERERWGAPWTSRHLTAGLTYAAETGNHPR